MHAGHPLIHLHQFRHMREIQFWIHAQGKHIHGYGDDIRIACALPVAKQRSLDAVSSCQNPHLRISNAAAPIVMGMEGKHHIVTILEVLGDISHLHCIDMRHGHLHRHRDIDNRLAVFCRLPDIQHRIADFQCVLRLRARKALRRILKAVVRPCFLCQLFQKLRSVYGNLLDFLFGHAEHLLPLCYRSGIVDVNDGIFDALESLKGLADDMFPRLCQHLHGHIIGNEIVLHQTAQKSVLRLRGSGKAHLDFLEAHL